MNNRVTQFINYFNTPIDTIDVLNNNINNKINPIKCILFLDYTLSLIYLINKTYLGDDVTLSEKDIVKHFNWCWVKNNNNFRSEGFNFLDTGEHQRFFIDFLICNYYNINQNKNNIVEHLHDIWSHILSYDESKTNAQYDYFLEIYFLLDNNLML